MTENTNIESTSTEEVKTYTQEEVDALLQREGDKRVTDALKKAERKNEKRIQEATKLAKMDEEQRYQYELEQREKAIQEKERALALAENKATAASILSNRGMSADLVSLVVAEDADTMNENINLLDKAFKSSVKAEIEKRLSSSTPKKNLPLDSAITVEQFHAMPLSKQAQIAREQPSLYEQLTKR